MSYFLKLFFLRILVLDAGVIKEFDTPTNLLKDTTSMFYGMTKDAGLHIPWWRIILKMNRVDGIITAVCHGYIEEWLYFRGWYIGIYENSLCLWCPVWFPRMHNVKQNLCFVNLPWTVLLVGGENGRIIFLLLILFLTML